jgi:hypothetical protein
MTTQLPDDIEQNLLDGQRLRATHELMKRRGLSINEARTEGRAMAVRAATS